MINIILYYTILNSMINYVLYDTYFLYDKYYIAGCNFILNTMVIFKYIQKYDIT